MTVMAMNPCQCGYYPDRNKCNCSPSQINRYFGKISKPLIDRIDLCVRHFLFLYKDLGKSQNGVLCKYKKKDNDG